MNDEPGFQFVDTNVIIYAYDPSAGAKHSRARTLLETLWESEQGCLSIQVLQEFYVNVSQKIASPLSPETAAQIIADLGTWRVHTPGVEDVLGAIVLQDRYQISFWDAMILHSAGQLGCAVAWSEDLNAGQLYQDVRVVNPFTT